MNFLLYTSINRIATFINGPANLLNNLPKNPPDCINFLFELYLI